MCVAAVIQNPDPVSLADLTAMEKSNPHGGGIAWPDGSLVHYRKGLTAKQIHGMQDKLPRPYLLHFRWATQGSKIPQLAHPFPIGPQAAVDAIEGHTTGLAESVLIHNGTWRGQACDDMISTLSRVYGIGRKRISDTLAAAYVAGWDASILHRVPWSVATMRSDAGQADVTYVGDWQEHGGNMFSNLHWHARSWESDLYGWVRDEKSARAGKSHARARGPFTPVRPLPPQSKVIHARKRGAPTPTIGAVLDARERAAAAIVADTDATGETYEQYWERKERVRAADQWDEMQAAQEALRALGFSR